MAVSESVGRSALSVEPGQISDLMVSWIRPSETNRKVFDLVALGELAQSIREHGVLQPLIVRRLEARGSGLGDETAPPYEIVAGERRWRAAIIAELQTVPCIVRELGEVAFEELRLIENLQREGVHPLDEAASYRRLLGLREENTSPEACATDPIQDIATKVGKSKSYVYQRLQLLELSEPVLAALREKRITASHADLIKRLPEEKQARALQLCFVDDEGLTPFDGDDWGEGEWELCSIRRFEKNLEEEWPKPKPAIVPTPTGGGSQDQTHVGRQQNLPLRERFQAKPEDLAALRDEEKRDREIENEIRSALMSQLATKKLSGLSPRELLGECVRGWLDEYGNPESILERVGFKYPDESEEDGREWDEDAEIQKWIDAAEMQTLLNIVARLRYTRDQRAIVQDAQSVGVDVAAVRSEIEAKHGGPSRAFELRLLLTDQELAHEWTVSVDEVRAIKQRWRDAAPTPVLLAAMEEDLDNAWSWKQAVRQFVDPENYFEALAKDTEDYDETEADEDQVATNPADQKIAEAKANLAGNPAIEAQAPISSVVDRPSSVEPEPSESDLQRLEEEAAESIGLTFEEFGQIKTHWRASESITAEQRKALWNLSDEDFAKAIDAHVTVEDYFAAKDGSAGGSTS